jgi:glycine/D-amino acid oxidase-like deaminating enzyme
MADIRRSMTRRVLIGTGMAAAGAAALGAGYLMSRKGGGIVPGVSRARVITGDSSTPANADVVVIGGGNIGCLTALSLAERGVKVALCEKGVIAGEASGRSLGYVDSLFLDPSKVEIVNRSKQLWDEMNSRVGTDTGYRKCGIAALFNTEEGVDAAKAWLASIQGRPGADGQVLGRKEASALAIGSPDRIEGALCVPSDAIVEPQLAAPAIAEQVRRRGGVVLQNCAVRGIETTAGKTSAVVTEKGLISCTSVVVAGGIWSPIFLRSLGLDLPQFMAFGYAMRFHPAQGPSAALIATYRNLVMRRTHNGYYDACRPVASTPITPSTVRNLWRLLPALRRMGNQLEPVLNLSTFISQWRIPTRWALDQPSPFEHNRIFMPENRMDMLDEVAADMQEAFPAIARAGEVERWSGAMMTTLDNMPVISAVDGHPGLFIGSGFYYGLTMAPAAGEALADLIMGHKPQIDLGLYRFSRFSDGSPIVFRE